MAVATLAVRLTAQIAEFQKSFADAARYAKKFGDEFEGVATRAATVGTFFGTIGADIAGSLARGLGGAIRDAIRFSSEFSNAFIGLGSVARAFGADTGAATTAAKRLSADGLLPLKDSATGLKNLLATGFNLPQATQLMNAFKDSAAFGRAGALSFGDAVRTATEGVKNGNSILVDNAGITKNLSQILKEAGYSAQDLSRASSDAGVRMALFNGILKESAAFAGDAERATQTYSGQVARLESTYNTFLATLGDVITQNATVARALGALGDAFRGLTIGLTDNKRGFTLVSDAVLLFVRALSTTLNVVDLVQTAFAGLQITVNRMFQGIANAGTAYLKFGEKAASVMRFLDPINFQRHTAAMNEARAAYTFLEGAVKGFGDASKDSQARSDRFGNALQESRATVNKLATELEATRGKTVEFGKSGETAGRAFGDAITTGADKVKKGLKKIGDAIEDVNSKIRIGLGSAPGFDVNLTANVDKILAELKAVQNGPAFTIPIKIGISGSIGENVTAIVKSIPKLSLGEQLFDPTEIGNALGNAINLAIQGGGNVFAAAAGTLGQVFTTNFAKYLTGAASAGGLAISGFLGGAINAVLPGLGALLGPLVGKITGALADAFGGPSKDELQGRQLVSAFESQLQSALSATERLAHGNESWKLTTIAVRDAYLAAGRTAAEAEADVKELWDSSRGGAKDAELAILKIKAVMEQVGKAGNDAVANAAANAAAAQSPAVAALAAQIDGLKSKYDSLFQSIANEAPEEVMGVVEANTRAQMAAIEAQMAALATAGATSASIVATTGVKLDEVGASAREALGEVESAVTDAAVGMREGMSDAARDTIAALNAEFARLGLPPVEVSYDMGLPQLKDETQRTADEIERILKSIKIPPIRVGVEIDEPRLQTLGLDVPALATGGIVRRPTLALVGEAGPEAVVPLDRMASVSRSSVGSGDVHVQSVTIHTQNGDPEEMNRQFWAAVAKGGKRKTMARAALGIT
jgi:hypothetical protein